MLAELFTSYIGAGPTLKHPRPTVSAGFWSV